MDKIFRISAGRYENLAGYRIEEHDGTWFLTYPGQRHPDDAYATLKEAKEAVDTHQHASLPGTRQRWPYGG